MSRCTDTERGARLVFDLAREYLSQGELFVGPHADRLRAEMEAAQVAAELELQDCAALRRAVSA